MIFVDSSVLVAASIVSHVHFQASDALIRIHGNGDMACSAHALAETYSVLSTYPLERRIRPGEAIEIVEGLRKLCTVIALSPKEYLAFLQEAAKREIRGGAIYDALHVACARKMHADRIYTWNTRHFKAVAPELALRIHEP